MVNPKKLKWESNSIWAHRVYVCLYGALNTIQWDTYTIEWDILICKRTFRFKNKKTPLDYKL